MQTKEYRFTEEELELLRFFKDNEQCLKAIRKVMYQMPLNAVELSSISLVKPSIWAVVRKCFLPVLDGEAPLGQVIDLFMTCPLKDLMPDIADYHLESIKLWEDYINQQLTELETKEKGQLSFREMRSLEGKSYRSRYIDMMARNTIINHTEAQLVQIKTLSNLTKPTQEELEEREEKNSSK